MLLLDFNIAGKVVRLTIGDVRTWGIDSAQEEARRLQIIVDNGDDPRHVRLAKQEAKAAAFADKAAQLARESVTLGSAWSEYITDRTPHWRAATLLAHQQVMEAGGVQRKRRAALTLQTHWHPIIKRALLPA